MSTIRYIRRWISRKPLEIEAWFQRTTNRKWHMDYQMVTWPMTSSPWKVKLVTPIFLERNISKTAGFRDSVPKDQQQEMPYGLSNGHVTDNVTWLLKVLWSNTVGVGYPSDSLASCLLIAQFYLVWHTDSLLLQVGLFCCTIAKIGGSRWNYSLDGAEVFL